MRMHRHDRSFHYSLVALIQPWDLIFFFYLLLLKEITKSYREHDDTVQVMFKAYVQ